MSFPCPLSVRLCSSPLGPGSFVGLALCPLPGGLRWEGGQQVEGLGFERWTRPQPCPTMSCPGQEMVTGGGDTVGVLWLLLLEGLVSGLCPDCGTPMQSSVCLGRSYRGHIRSQSMLTGRVCPLMVTHLMLSPVQGLRPLGLPSCLPHTQA